jgi:hypothetical protein
MKWILLVKRRKPAMLLAYEFDSESEAQALYDSAIENSDANVRVFRATLIRERA